MTDLPAQLQDALGSAYRLERELGGGGMSRVFVAEETALGRRIVLKVLPPELGAGLSVDRFRREIQLAASLHHPNIVPLLTAGEAGGLLYYTMPLIEGDSLRTRLAREGELPVGEAVRLLRDVVDALACAHERGVVHRDIKPDNVLLSRHHAMVTDFGVAKALSEATGRHTLTSVGVALGTPAYMAPEQATADPHTDHRADIYAVGALGYEMLAGRPPFTGPTPQAVLAAQVTQAPEPVTRTRASVPPALAALIMRCLEKRPADRWQTADELLHQLEAMATPSGGMAPTGATAAVATGGQATAPAPAAGRPQRWHRAGYLVLGLLLALGVAWGVSRYRGGRSPAGPATGAQTVVVLPFENLGRPEDAYFADGITEEITNRLTGITGLRVIARSSARQYKGTTKPLRQVGEELGATYVLEGTVRWERAGDTTSRVRVSPELIKVADGTSVWAHGYDAVMAGVFQVQSDIAEQVAGALNVALAAPERQALAERPTSNAQAYDYYLQGNDYLQRSYSELDLKAAESLLQKAVALDSTFALAHAGLALVHDFLYWFYYDRTERRLALLREAAETALRLQPSLPEAHLALGYYYYHGLLDYPRALAEVDLARRGRPNDADILSLFAFIQRRQGKWEDALRNLAQATELDPRSAKGFAEAAWTSVALGRYPQAEQWLQRAITIAPADPVAYVVLADVYLARDGDLERVRETVLAAFKNAGRDPTLAVVVGLRNELLLALHPSDLPQLHGVSPSALGDDTSRYFEWRAALSALERAPAEERAYLDSARAVLETRLAARPQEHFYHIRLGQILARLGLKPDAIREARTAVGLMPMTKDALDGSAVAYRVARIYATIGEKDAAIEQLGRFLAVPHIPPVSPTWLKLDPLWDPVRADPRFQRLMAGAR